MPFYFAYGSNMDVAAMAQRCPRSRVIGPARLARHRFTIMKEGFATVVRDPQAMVHGLLFDLALADIPALDRYENVAGGLYQKVTQPVLRASGGPARALVYVGRSAETRGAPIRPGYMEGVVAAAEALGCPRDYLTYLRSFVPGLAQADAGAQPQRRAIKYTGKPLFGDADE